MQWPTSASFTHQQQPVDLLIQAQSSKQDALVCALSQWGRRHCTLKDVVSFLSCAASSRTSTSSLSGVLSGTSHEFGLYTLEETLAWLNRDKRTMGM